MMTSPQAPSAQFFSWTGGASGIDGKTPMLKTRDLSVLGYANGFTLWHFVTVDPAMEIQATGYFNEAADMFRPGDLIFANLHQSPNDVSSLLLSITRIDHGNVALGTIGQTEGQEARKEDRQE